MIEDDTLLVEATKWGGIGGGDHLAGEIDGGGSAGAPSGRPGSLVPQLKVRLVPSCRPGCMGKESRLPRCWDPWAALLAARILLEAAWVLPGRGWVLPEGGVVSF